MIIKQKDRHTEIGSLSFALYCTCLSAVKLVCFQYFLIGGWLMAKALFIEIKNKQKPCKGTPALYSNRESFPAASTHCGLPSFGFLSGA